MPPIVRPRWRCYPVRRSPAEWETEGSQRRILGPRTLPAALEGPFLSVSRLPSCFQRAQMSRFGFSPECDVAGF
ncbi:hypothetical protein CERSUDRAFT_107495 [Gelatoporia subvermispora B]|uniref:Uncharacterized protein n=1 Tax=Ceriporiopsis subvermispora (strain B) TaxID=914234 RepID=M2QBA6_CERS8|nr:hypothetical protein CERSUDRAFT_107495 [Gelatoporia subvermispora B]